MNDANVYHLPSTLNQAHVPPRADRDWVTGSELINSAGITWRQLDYWARTGLLTPLDHTILGGFHEAQVDRARAIKQLLDAGISPTTIRRHLDDFVTTGRIEVGPITIAKEIS